MNSNNVTGVALAFKPLLVRQFIRRVYGLVVILGKPKSRGTVRLASRRAAELRTLLQHHKVYVTDWADRTSYPVHRKGRIWRLATKAGTEAVKPAHAEPR